MSWFDKAWDYLTDVDFKDPKNTGLTEDILSFLGTSPENTDWSAILSLGGSALANALGYNDTNQRPTGYQGKIPEYQVVRERVPTSDEERRPGETGRRYFSDMIYAQRPKTETPAVAQAQGQMQQQAAQLAQQEAMRRAQATNEAVQMAAGGLASLPPKGYYLGGATDGMADQVPASIDGVQEARLSDGEFVVPADVVSHLGNGNSSAGAKQLYDMMDRIRKARTGTEQQGKQVNPTKYTPA
jgi:hypothetical protein